MSLKVFPVLPLALSIASVVQAESSQPVEEVLITTTRSSTKAEDLPQVVTVITREQIEQQLATTSDTSQILSNLLPAFSPNRQKLTSSGETFRGRTPLFLIDGVPQSNPLRAAGREGQTIDLSMVERIEVIHGASAIHGLGATGGIINFITRRPSGEELGQYLSVQTTLPANEWDADGVGYRANYRLEAAQDGFEYLLGVSYQKQGIYLDAKGTPVGVDNTQGDLMDSHGYDIFAKVAYWFTPEQHVNFEVNRFESKGDMNYVSVNGDRSKGIPTTSVEGDPVGLAPRNQVLTTSLSYQHDDFFGAVLNAQAYRQEFEGLFGATLTSTFQDVKIAPLNTLYDQSQANSEKLGAKLTLSKDEVFIKALKLTGGVDVLEDTTNQTLELTNRVWVPDSTYNNYAPFLQAEIKPFPSLVLHTGVRYEHAELEVDTFTTIASAKSVVVQGGKPEFSETLRNLGLVYTPWQGISFFANYSEGFGMPDVGRVLRGINQPNLDIDDFLNLEPILTDNSELGVRFNRGPVSAELSYYESNSDLGARLQRVNGIYFVTRERTDIDGYEANIGYRINDGQRVKLAYARSNGEYDSNADGKLDARLDALNMSPDRIVLTWEARWTEKLSTNAQINYAYDRQFDDPLKEFHGYTLADLSLNYGLPVGQLSAALTNAFNKDYYTYYSQSAVLENERYFKGRGRTLVLGYSLEF